MPPCASGITDAITGSPPNFSAFQGQASMSGLKTPIEHVIKGGCSPPGIFSTLAEHSSPRSSPQSPKTHLVARMTTHSSSAQLSTT